MSNEPLHLAHEDFGDPPLGWGRGTLGEIGTYINGRGFKASEWGETGLPIIRIQNLTGSKDTVNYFDGPVDPRHLVEPGDLLISWAATLGVYRWSGPKAALNQHIFKVESHIDDGFHYHLTRFILAELSGETHGSGMEHITKTAFEAVSVPVPPLPEQRRVSERLSLINERVSGLRCDVEAALQLMAQCRRAILAVAMTGGLTRTWRETHGSTESAGEYLRRLTGKDVEPSPAAESLGLPDGWTCVGCDDLTDADRALTYGVIKLGPQVDGGVPVLRSSNVRYLRIDASIVKSVASAISAEYERTVLRGGEVLVTVRGSLGGVAVAPAEMKGFNVSREVAVVPLVAGLDAEFVAHALGSPHTQRWLRDVSVGVAYTGINIRDLKRVPVPIPPPEEQAEIMRRLDDAYARLSDLEDAIRAAGRRVSAIDAAALAKAFRGELVRSEASLAAKAGRDFESGEELLERIRAAG